MNVKLGLDLNCFSNRYLEPEAWTDLVASMGIRVVQFNFDIIDFLLPNAIQDRLVAGTVRCCRTKNIRIKCAFGGHNHHQNYLGHPDNEVARAYEKFYKRMADLTVALGGEGFGTCFAITTVNVQKNAKRRSEILDRAVEAYHRIAAYAKRIGLRYLLYEITSVPRETGATFQENDLILEQMKEAAVPMMLCLDVGHRNRQNPHAPEADPYRWIEKYANVSPLIHIHQCNAGGSHHWPFTAEYNAKGDVSPDKLLQVLKKSGVEHEVLLALEIRHRAYYPDEDKIEENLLRSVEYWRQWIVD